MAVSTLTSKGKITLPQTVRTRLGIEAGMSDYISKPFSVSELRARVNAFLLRKRLQASSRPVQQFGDVEVDADLFKPVSGDGDIPGLDGNLQGAGLAKLPQEIAKLVVCR